MSLLALLVNTHYKRTKISFKIIFTITNLRCTFYRYPPTPQKRWDKVQFSNCLRIAVTLTLSMLTDLEVGTSCVWSR